MALTPAQLATLKAAILADPVLAAYPAGAASSYPIAAAFNELASPAFIVWRTSVPFDEIMRNGMDWTRVDNLSVGKSRIWDWMTRLGTLNPSQANIRAGIDAAWVGTAADLAVRAAVYVHCKRSATRAEKLYATGTGSDAVPATLVVEGNLSPDEVQQARELP
jgi:hypothetical protein